MAQHGEDALRPLRAALHQPDQRTWRRHLARPAHAVRRRTHDNRLAPARFWGESGPGPGGAGDERRVPDAVFDERPRPRLALWQVVAAVLVLAGGIVLASGWLPADAPAPEADGAGSGPGATEVSSGDPAGDDLPPDGDAPRNGGGTSAVRLWPVAEVQVTGREVRTDAGHWEVGTEGDVVTVGDWDCDRLPTPAVLRPSTGRVAVFDAWAMEGPALAARSVASVPGAVAVDASTTCGEIVVRSAEGVEQVVDTTPAGGA